MFFLGARGLLYKPLSFVVVISPLFLPFILKIALSLQAPPTPTPNWSGASPERQCDPGARS